MRQKSDKARKRKKTGNKGQIGIMCGKGNKRKICDGNVRSVKV